MQKWVGEKKIKQLSIAGVIKQFMQAFSIALISSLESQNVIALTSGSDKDMCVINVKWECSVGDQNKKKWSKLC